MKVYDKTWLKASVASDMRRIANYGTYDGWVHNTGKYAERCRALHRPTGSVLMFTRDENMHLSGWWKNPDYERCYHLSLSFRDPGNGQVAPRDKALTREWVELFYGKDRDKLWCEPPYSAQGKQVECWHYRLFCAPDWSPLLPRGEVYSREFTEARWKSWSDVQAELKTDADLVAAMKADASRHQAAEG